MMTETTNSATPELAPETVAYAMLGAMSGASHYYSAALNDIAELLSEAAVEIANLDSPDNPVAKRLRAALGEGGKC